MSGWSVDGPVGAKLPIKGWWATIQNTLTDTGVGTDLVIQRSKNRLVDQGRGQDIASARLLPSLLSSETGVGTDRLPMRPKFDGSEGATGSDLARVGPRVFDEGRGIDTVNTKYRVLGLDLARGYDLSTARKVGQRPWDAACGQDVATNGWHAQSAINQTFTAAGTFTIPYWCRYLDLVLIGGGASGQTGNGGNGQAGKGGNPSSWVTVTLERGVDIALTAISLSVAVGTGGLTSADSDFAGPNSGSASSVSGSGITTVSAAGGSGTRGEQNGASPGNVDYQGIVLAGGSAGTGNAGVGQAPGASGAGGNGGFFARQRVNKNGGYATNNGTVTGWTSDSTYPATITSDQLVVQGSGTATPKAVVVVTGWNGGAAQVALHHNGVSIGSTTINGSTTFTISPAARAFAAGDKLDLRVTNGFGSLTGTITTGTYVEVYSLRTQGGAGARGVVVIQARQ